MLDAPIDPAVFGGLDVALPPMAPVRQHFAAPRELDVTAAVARELAIPDIASRITAGARIAVGVGSRGIAQHGAIVRAMLAALLARGARPFVVPAMGSHGAATAEGQRRVLEDFGLAERDTGVPIVASMDTVVVGRLDDGTPVHVDRHAAAADGIVVVNRVKPHTTFHAPHESGLVKMLAIGLGKIDGATQLHAHGMDRFEQLLPAAARVVMQAVPVLFGLAVLENAYDETARIEAVPADSFFTREPELLAIARTAMPRLLFDELDVLVIDEMGKNISGTGFDPNVTGRNKRAVPWPAVPRIAKIAVLGLTPETHGNANGMGSADVVTWRLFQAIDTASTYANCITARYIDGAAIPVVMRDDHDAVALAVRTLVRRRAQDARIVRIRNTLALGNIEVSAPLLAEVSARPDAFTVLGPPRPWAFDADGRLAPLAAHAPATPTPEGLPA
ncbi:MAG: nickel-dependent lactate racemase [Burkholderiales bacterium]|jgi:hypothetical protein|nr:nickel-dependent lactate racemase [Burkholderiales bacterium]